MRGYASRIILPFIIVFILSQVLMFCHSSIQKENYLFLEEAQTYISHLPAQKVILIDENRKYIWPLNYQDLGIQYQLLQEETHQWLGHNQYKIAVQYDTLYMMEKILKLYQEHLQTAQNAYFHIDYDNNVTIVPEQAGQTLDQGAILADLSTQIDMRTNGGVVVLKSRWHNPQITAADLEMLEINGLLGEYSTQFDGSNQYRVNNIWLASSKIEGYLLAPKAQFSFNEVVGARTLERGFLKADVLINSQHGVDVGGGVCQVSTTLYNAAKKAGLEMTELHHHSVPVRYVAKGNDATVVYDEKDLRFVNTTDHTILIKSYFAYGKLTFKIFGHI